ncbi:hypothetical protein POX_e06207 [Penicillium oxalicum]|uniref:hypothetical protein n=1 Tax=Penicillium oxalicum TaxID=69781 RepID=UPI0020B80163|nr:hypothetical protein POX_e06207 [Penicillium oxalicum]KAI2788194.1 hypothetical protein POX_e06207 [Penicillium oxalicum]
MRVDTRWPARYRGSAPIVTTGVPFSVGADELGKGPESLRKNECDGFIRAPNDDGGQVLDVELLELRSSLLTRPSDPTPQPEGASWTVAGLDQLVMRWTLRSSYSSRSTAHVIFHVLHVTSPSNPSACCMDDHRCLRFYPTTN